jgi:hypothetical protein
MFKCFPLEEELMIRVIFLILIICVAQNVVSFAQQTQSLPSAEDVFPKPGPELEPLTKEAGTWDAIVEARIAPDAPPIMSKGIETNVIGGTGLWLITNFKTQFLGKPFEGHGIYGYDEEKKKYTGVWVDSFQTYLAVWEGTFDSANRMMTMWTETPDATGKMIRWKGVTEWKDDDTRIWTGYMPGEDGKDFATMIIRYKRRK